MSTLFGTSRYGTLRYAVVIELLAALGPAMRVKGRIHDPLRQSAWWTVDQHSAVLAVALAAIAGTGLVFLAMRRVARPGWALVGCGLFAGLLPAAFYAALAPAGADVPLAGMLADGTLYGLIAGAVLYGLARAQPPAAAVRPGSSGRTPGP